jgi:DNA replication and repair protein RecF
MTEASGGSEGAIRVGGTTLIKRLSLRNFRNMELVSFEPAPRLNLIFGDNGHGKTSLIEALYVVATTKSFRSQRLFETIREGSERAEIRAEIESFGLKRELRAAISERGRSFLIDGKRPKRYVDYALKTPVIAFHPADLTLASGPSGERRTLLDRILLHQDPAGSSARLAYQQAVRERQKLLSERGLGARELEAYEQVIATQGARFAQGRYHAAQTVIEALGPAFRRMAPEELPCEASYVPGGTTDVALFVRELAERRSRDLHRG